MTKNPLKNVLQGPEEVGRLILYVIELSEFNIEYVPRKAIKAQVVTKVLADFVEGEIKEPKLGICGKV